MNKTTAASSDTETKKINISMEYSSLCFRVILQPISMIYPNSVYYVTAVYLFALFNVDFSANYVIFVTTSQDVNQDAHVY